MKQTKYAKSAVEIAQELGVSPAIVRIWRNTGRKPKNAVIAALYKRIEVKL